MELIKIKDVLKLNHKEELNYNDIVFIEKYYDMYHINIKNCRGYNTNNNEELKYHIEKINNTFKTIIKINKELEKNNKSELLTDNKTLYVNYSEYLKEYDINYYSNHYKLNNKHGLNVQLFELLN